MRLMATHSAASTSAEDYAKAIYSLTRETPDEGASTNDLAERLGISTGAVSTMIRRLDDAGLAEHVPYHGVRLTDDGRRLALRVIRRHRILELFLVHSGRLRILFRWPSHRTPRGRRAQSPRRLCVLSVCSSGFPCGPRRPLWL